MNIKQRAVRRFRVAGPAATLDVGHSVSCPAHGHTIDFAKCCACPRREEVHVTQDGGATIDCRTTAPPERKGRVDVAEAAIRARLLDIVGDDTTCVRPELGLTAAAELFAKEGIRAAPVVDPDGRLVGVLSRTDLRGRKKNGTVSDAMSTVAHALPEEAPVAYAISLMARDRIHEVPLVDPQGRVVGMVSAIDALRWVAEALGYVMP